eukprot:TRINITY_DN9978_c0_g1_i2.p1 TRINITY_DN9978_c0_g1~~TRINITY_DN9978_c0_g1_i2.p1  ORF type:complete len:206 (+),score=21.88 TRINITY_DN9978_c0_g1_i2:149-766(+)
MVGFRNPEVHELYCIRLNNVCRPGAKVVDATAGNGHDALFLARSITSAGTLVCYDVQKAALETTEQRLSTIPEKERPRIVYLNESHSNIHTLDLQPDLVVFNLGYRPGDGKTRVDVGKGDRIMTLPETTKMAVERAVKKLNPSGGLVSVLAYTGHGETGIKELEAVEEISSSLNPDEFKFFHIKLANRKSSPLLILIFKYLAKER